MIYLSRILAVVYVLAAGLFFGLWQKDVYAGIFMLYFTLIMSIKKE